MADPWDAIPNATDSQTASSADPWAAIPDAPKAKPRVVPTKIQEVENAAPLADLPASLGGGASEIPEKSRMISREDFVNGIKPVAQFAIEGAGTTLGAAGGALLPVPGTTLLGAGAGYAAGKRAGQAIFGEDIDVSAGGIATDVGLGAVFQGAGKVVGKIPVVKNILSPKVADIGPEAKAGGALSKQMMEKSLKIPPSGKIGYTKIDRAKVLDTMLKEKIPITRGGLDRVRGTMDSLLEQMDEVILQNPNAPIATDSVLGPVREFQTWASNTVNGDKFAKKIEGVIKAFKKQYGDTLTLEQAQEVKQTTNAFIRKSYGELKPVTEEAQKQIVRGLKERIAQEVPKIANINLKYGEMRQVELALERALNRTGNWDWFNLSAGMAGTIVGGTTGNLMKASEAVGFYRLLKAPWFQSHLAIILRNAGAGGKSNAIANTMAVSAYKEAKQYLSDNSKSDVRNLSNEDLLKALEGR